jgi:signal transduction histidine kinase
MIESAFFNRNKLYEIVDDIPIGISRRRIVYRVYWVNKFFVTPELVGWNHAVFSYIPLLFSQHPLLRHIPGFKLDRADVHFEFPEGDYSGTWQITVDYDITPIDRFRSWFNLGELQETVAALSAEVLELQRDRKALSEEAERLAGQLIEAEKLAAVGRLSFGVGHDLRNTLATSINSGIPLQRLVADFQTVIRMLAEGKPRSEIQDFLNQRKLPIRLSQAPGNYETMMNSLAQALENVKALEGYAIEDASDFQEMRIENVIEKVLHDLREDLQGIQVETRFEAGEYEFKGNPLKLYDVFRNLVLNAIEATEGAEQPQIIILTHLEDGVHQTVIEDNGYGMSEEARKHAFEPFFTTKELSAGRQRGLGLFNAWRLVQQHGGKISIISEPGKFTKLFIEMKLVSYRE